MYWLAAVAAQALSLAADWWLSDRAAANSQTPLADKEVRSYHNYIIYIFISLINNDDDFNEFGSTEFCALFIQPVHIVWARSGNY